MAGWSFLIHHDCSERGDEVYLMGEDAYVCDCCGVEIPRDGADNRHGDMWECEICGMNFCTKCFVDRLGRSAFDEMIRGRDKVLCCKCFEKGES